MTKIDPNAPIGVFDSGVGGLTVAREIMRNLPMEKIIYFGDTARVPYGSKSRDTVIRYSRQIVRFLREQQVKAIVVACNTASALALSTLEEESDIPIIGVVKPGARVAIETTKKKRVGVIATEATINSHLYRELILQMDPEITVVGRPCPLFVPLVEEGWLHDSVTETVARRYLKDLQDQDIDTLILGCTHYPLLRSLIGEIMGERVTLVNPAYETSLALKRLLEAGGMMNPGTARSEFPYRFFVSDAAEKFKHFANSILPFDVNMTEQINIEEY
ncbi:MAG: glutamate racemase [Clostridiales bacterium]|nr:glutamate racemase [Clostridiales bacterium]